MTQDHFLPKKPFPKVDGSTICIFPANEPRYRQMARAISDSYFILDTRQIFEDISSSRSLTMIAIPATHRKKPTKTESKRNAVPSKGMPAYANREVSSK